MKKTILSIIVLFSIGCSGHTTSGNGFEDYRYNPFQFPYPEYHMKADITPIQPKAMPDHFTEIETFDVTFRVDKKYADVVQKKNETYAVKRSGALSFIVMSSEEQWMGCNEDVRKIEKDYCSAFASTEEFHRKLFLLTPDDLSQKQYQAAGNRWIVHRKGFLFENVRTIHIYETQDFTIYRKDMKPSDAHNVAIELVIFDKHNPDDYLTMAFPQRNELLIRQILESIRN